MSNLPSPNPTPRLALKLVQRLFVVLFWLLGAAVLAPSAARAQASVDWLVSIGDGAFDLQPAGTLLEYDVVVTNNGTSLAPATTVTLTIPATTTMTDAVYGASSGPCTPLPATGPATVVCDIGELGDGASADFVAILQASEEGSFAVTARVDDPLDVDPDDGNNVQTENTTAIAGSDIGVDLIAPVSAARGEFVDLDVVVTNNGPSDASSFIVDFPIPPGMANFTPPAGCVLSGGTYSCTVGPLADGASTTLTFNGQIVVTNASTIAATASVRGASPADAIPGNNTDSEIFPVTGGIDLAVGISSDATGTLLTGDPVTFTVTSSYTGDDPSDIVITHVVPDNFDFDIGDFSAPDWTIAVGGPDGRTITFSRPAGSGPGQDVAFDTITMPMTTVQQGNPVSAVEIAGSGPAESNPGNNTAQVVTPIVDPVVDLRANKTGPFLDLAVVGESHDYRISATNVGNADFVGRIFMTDQVPAGLTVTSIATNGWNCAPNPGGAGPFTLVCELDLTAGTLAPGATTPAVVYTATVTDPGTIPNTMTVSATDTPVLFDENPANDSTTVQVEAVLPGDAADVGLNKTVAEALLPAGEVQTYTIEITNAGPAVAETVAIRDDLLSLINSAAGPDEGFVSATPVPGPHAAGLTCGSSALGSTGRRLDCNIASLAICTPGSDCPTITVEVRHGGEAGTIPNTASAYSQDTPDPDLGDNVDSTVFTQDARVDITVEKTVNAPEVAVGQNVTYTVTARNVDNGLSSAEDVTLVDTLPQNVVFVSASPSPACVATATPGDPVAPGDTVTCNFDTLANGQQQAATIVVRPLRAALPGPLTNGAAVTTSTTETDVEPNTDSVDTTLTPPVTDLLVNKDDGGFDPVPVGEDVTYTITVTNRGPSASEDLEVIDTLPGSVISFQSAQLENGDPCTSTPAPGSFGGVVRCDLPYLEAGASFSVDVVVRAETRGSIVNNVEIDSYEIANGYDTLAGNNINEENTTVRTRADIEVVSKVAVPGTVALEDDFVYEITVRANTGPGLDLAEQVVIADTLPANMVLTGTPSTPYAPGACTGTAGQSSFSCDIGDVLDGDTFVISVPVEVRAATSDPQVLSNTASATTASFEDNTGNNSAAGPVSVVSSEISGTVYRDFDKDVSQNLAEDTGVAGVTMTLTGTTGDGRNIGTITVVTDSNGNYVFPNLPAGTYTVTRGTISDPYLLTGVSDIGGNGASSSTPLTIIGIPLGDDDVGPDNDFTVNPQPRIGIAKRVLGPVVVNPDGSFETRFRMVVENFSAEGLTGVEVTDTLSGAVPRFGSLAAVADPDNDPLAAGTYAILAAPSGSCGGLVPGFDGDAEPRLATGFSMAATSTCTIDVSVRAQPPLPLPPVRPSGGRFENQASASGTGALSGDPVTDVSDNGSNPDPNNNGRANDANESDPTPVAPAWNPDITLTKTSSTAAFSVPPQPGDVIAYSFEVENTGNLTLTGIVLSDPLPGIVLDSTTIAALAPGESQTLTGSYAISQADIDAGERSNTASVTADDVFGAEQTDTSPLVTPIDQVISVAVIKSVATNGVQDPTVVGDPISYAFEVRNTGNVTLTDVTLSDPLPGITVNGGPIATLAPGATDTTTFTADYAVVQSDIDAGGVVNQATVSALDPDSSPVTDLSGDTFGDDNPLSVPTFRDSAVALVKTALTGALSDPPLEGETVSYDLTVTNTGNTTLTNVAVTDPLPGIVITGSPVATLAPGAANAVTLTATYALTQDDIDAGLLPNQATVVADEPGGGTVSDLSGETNDDDLPTEVPLDQAPAIALVKIGDVTALSDPPQEGDTVTFRFQVRNTGNVTLTGITLSDSLPGIVPAGGPLASLAPGATDTTTFTATYVLTQTDVDAGEIENTATATGTAPDSSTVSDISGTDFASDGPTTVPLAAEPSIALVKTADTAGLSVPPRAGDVIAYDFAVTNTGNVTLTGVTISDILDGIVLSGGPIASLDPGATDDATISATYTLTQADVDAGTVVNSATATGSPPSGDDVSDVSGTTAGDDTPTEVTLSREPAITLVKTADTAGLQSPPQVGDVIAYGFTVQNTGNVTLTNVTVTDLLPGLVLDGDPIPDLAPAEIDDTTFTATYAITLDDLTAGEVVNTATVTGNPPTGPPVEDISGTTAGDDAPTEVPLAQEPGISLVKVGDDSNLIDGAVEGEIITYSFTITNTGNAPLFDVTLTDDLPGILLVGGPIPLMNPAAANDGTDVDSVTYSATYAVTAADIANVEVINTATVTGGFGSDGGTVMAEDEEVTVAGTIEAIPEVFPPFTTDGGQTTSMLESDLLNGGPATLGTVTIRVIAEDPGVTLDPDTGIITLEPGRPAGVYEVTYEICSRDFPGLCDSTTETVVQGPLPGIETTKTQELVDNGDGRDDVGDTVIYTITVANTGNTVLSGVTVADTLVDLRGGAQSLTTGPDFVSADADSPEGTLQIGETATYTASFDITLEVVNARGLENAVLATGTPVLPAGVPGSTDPVSDLSDDGDDGDGNTTDDPTVLALSPSNTTAGLTLTKTTPRAIVERGAIVPYTITVTNENDFVVGPADIVDRLPAGFLYVEGSAVIDGSTATVSVDGSRVTFAGVTVPAEGEVVATLSARILNGVGSGEHVNRASLLDPATGERLTPDARATVRILPEAVFDCGEVIGKVFDDVNGNGYQDPAAAPGNNPQITDQTYGGGKLGGGKLGGGKLDTAAPETPQAETGLPGVRLAGVDGRIVTTDENGLFSVPCAMLPADRGSNFILKLDERSLPTGYAVTTENPRVMRLTPGMMTEMNFGARLETRVQVHLGDAAFAGAAGLSPEITGGIAAMLARIAADPTGIDLIYHLPARAGPEAVAAARANLALVEAEIERQWRDIGSGRLGIGQTIARAEDDQ